MSKKITNTIYFFRITFPNIKISNFLCFIFTKKINISWKIIQSFRKRYHILCKEKRKKKFTHTEELKKANVKSWYFSFEKSVEWNGRASEWARLFVTPRWLQATELNQLNFNPELESREEREQPPSFSSFCSIVWPKSSRDVNIYIYSHLNKEAEIGWRLTIKSALNFFLLNLNDFCKIPSSVIS